MDSYIPLQPISPQIFWGEIAPTEHIAQFYENDNVLVDTLTGFVGGGLNAGESSVVIATHEHLAALHRRLLDSNVDLTRAIAEDRYIALDAETSLARFMINQMPDEDQFRVFVEELMRRGTRNNRRVRAFGEMVALLWARGDSGATVRLEYLWNRIRQNGAFSLLCAYPKAGFTEDPTRSIAGICAAHSRIV
jgi:hypothetical protein